jgi:putative cell wall-binding protein
MLAAGSVLGALISAGSPAVAAPSPSGANVNPTWTQLAPGSTPAARAYAAVSYDGSDVLMFGGSIGPNFVSDTWLFDGTDWTQLNPVNSPPQLVQAMMAYDPNTGDTVLFGGLLWGGNATNETWLFHNGQWTQDVVAGNPPAVTNATMVWDPQLNEMVMFGGYGNGVGFNTATWAFDGTAWAQLNTATSPSQRESSTAAYDASTGDIVMYGGWGPQPLNDTWSFDGTDWTQLFPLDSPPPLTDAQMAYNPDGDAAILYGGYDGNAVQSETWSWDGIDWTQLNTVADVGPVMDGSLIDDPATDQLLLIDGMNGSSVINSTASFDYIAPASVAPVFTPTSAATSRTAGADRLATAVAISQQTFPKAGSAGAVIVAGQGAFPDALAAAPLAAAKRAPLLLTPTKVATPAVLAEITRVLPDGGTVYLIGGTTVLSPAVASAITAAGFHVQRIAGADRYATSVAIADVLGDPSTVLLADGTNFADGLSAGVAAAHVGGALLLTDGSTLPAATAAYLATKHGAVTAVGGQAAAADPSAIAVVGVDRYATSDKVAAMFFTAPKTVGVASGANFPDGLAAAAAMAVDGGPLLLSAPTTVAPATSSYLTSVKASLNSVNVYGGTSALSAQVVTEVSAATS